MRSFLFIFVIALLLGTLGSDKALAQRHAGYCDDARTTADALDCVNKHKQDVQERLNSIFDLAKDSRQPEGQELLDQAQTAWLSYRDTQCLWEAGLADNPSLERIYELSCVTLLTNLRADLLATTLETETQEQPREFGSHPRWMNVLIHDHPSVFWRFGKWAHMDLDCDGTKEQIVTGVEFDKDQPIEKLKTEGKMPLGANVVIAVAENPLTGRPKTDVFYIPVDDDKESKRISLCHADIDLSFVSSPEDSVVIEETEKLVSDEEEGVKIDSVTSVSLSCPTLQIIDRGCESLTLRWEDDQYELGYIEETGGEE